MCPLAQCTSVFLNPPSSYPQCVLVPPALYTGAFLYPPWSMYWCVPAHPFALCTGVLRHTHPNPSFSVLIYSLSDNQVCWWTYQPTTQCVCCTWSVMITLWRSVCVCDPLTSHVTHCVIYPPSDHLVYVIVLTCHHVLVYLWIPTLVHVLVCVCVCVYVWYLLTLVHHPLCTWTAISLFIVHDPPTSHATHCVWYINFIPSFIVLKHLLLTILPTVWSTQLHPTSMSSLGYLVCFLCVAFIDEYQVCCEWYTVMGNCYAWVPCQS